MTIKELEELTAKKATAIRERIGKESWMGITPDDTVLFCLEATRKYYKLGDA